MKIQIKNKTIEVPVTSSLYREIKAVLVEAADPKLSKNSPPAAHFHRMMREYHKGECKGYGPEDKKKADVKALINLHKQMAEEHNARYKDRKSVV